MSEKVSTNLKRKEKFMKSVYVLNGDKKRNEYPIIRVLEGGEIYDVADLSGGDLSIHDAWIVAEQIVYTMNNSEIIGKTF